MRRLLSFVLLLGLAAPAGAATRGFTVTGFDRIVAAGPFAVSVHTGPGVSVRATGDTQALDRLTVVVENNILRLRASNPIDGNWTDGDMGKVTIAVTVPALRAATLAGSGNVTVDRAKAEQFDAMLGGSGNLAIGALQAERANLSVIGSGDLTVAGTAGTVRVSVSGSGDLDAAELRTDDATVAVVGSGNARLAVAHKANVQATGSGDVTVTGSAICTINQNGSGNVQCGRQPPG